MDLILNEAETQFRGLIDMVSFDNAAWQNWLCLHIEAQGLEDIRLNMDILSYAEAIFEHYLQDYEGQVYFCGSQDLYILGRNIDLEEMREIADQICDGLMISDDRNVQKKIYDMASGLFELSFHSYDKGEFFKIYSAPTDFEPPLEAIETETQNSCPRVLLVEDDETTRWIVRKTLKGLCDFSVAGNAENAMKKMTSFKPDIVFLDIGLPDKSGRDVLKWIKREKIDARVVMFSGHNNLDNILETLREGASGFIAKPFLKENLLHYIHSYSA